MGQSSSRNRNAAELQRLLIGYYRTYLSFISISPIADDYEAPIEDFYVQPTMVSIDVQHRFLDCSPTMTPVTSYQQLLFSSQGKSQPSIYVTAEPGIGKTAFCKKLCAAWCQAHDPQEAQADKFSPDDISALKRFKFLFYISLREVGESTCHIDTMVEDFIKNRLSTASMHVESCCNYILHKQSCLIVLDGLDEWNHPKQCKYRQTPADIPHRKHHTNNTIVTTTRPWKLDIIRLHESEIDSHIQIEKLTDRQSEKLAIKCIALLNKKTTERKCVRDFVRATSLLHFNEVRSIPYIHTQCICLWYEGRSIGNSKSQVYSNIIELTLERAMGKMGRSQFESQEYHESSLPSCLKELKHCLQFLSLFGKVGKLAFSSLIKSESKQMLVMDVEFTREYLTEEELEQCLKLGLLNQEKSYRTVSRQTSNVYFEHKTLHEYFAAFYLYSASTSSEKEEVLASVIQKCRSPSDILEMSNMFVFLSGFDARLYCELYQRMADTVMQDDRIRRYRQTCVFWLLEADLNLALDYQKLQTDCAREMELNGQEVPALLLQDIIIDRDTKCEENLSLLQKITSENVKSLSITDCEREEEGTHVLQALDFTSLKCLQKLDLRCVARDQDVEQLLMQSQTTLQTLRLSNRYVKENRIVPSNRGLSRKCEELILLMSALQVMFLDGFILEHAQIQRLAFFITSRNTMTGVGLINIRCKDHNDSCAGVTLELSQHENIVELDLHVVPVSHLVLNTQHLKKCRIGEMAPCVIRTCLSCLPTAQHLRILACSSLHDTLPDLIDTIPALTQLEMLHISLTDLGDRRLVFSPSMTRLKLIGLQKVTLQSAVLQDLADALINHSLSVSVWLEDCTVTPQKDFQVLKKNMKTSWKTVVLKDGLDSNSSQIFAFETSS